MRRFLVPFIIMAIFWSCGTTKPIQPTPPTLAQICADSFPCRDSIIYVTSELPVDFPQQDTLIRDTFPCPPADSVTPVYITKVIRIPGKRIIVRDTMPCPTKKDEALRRAYQDVITKLKKAESELQKRKPAGGKGIPNWLSWLLIIAVTIQAFIILLNKIFKK